MTNVKTTEVQVTDLQMKALEEGDTRELLPYFKELIFELHHCSKDAAMLEWQDEDKALNNMIRLLLQHEKHTRYVRQVLKNYRNKLASKKK